MKVYSPDKVLSKWNSFVSHLESCYGAVRIEDDEMFMVEFWFQENRKVPRGFSDGDFVKNVYVSLDDFMGEKYVGFSSIVGNIIPENLDKAFKVVEKPLQGYPWNLENAPVQIHAKGKRMNEWSLYNGSAGPLPYSTQYQINTLPEEDIILVPYGCTTLRITEFPVTRK